MSVCVCVCVCVCVLTGDHVSWYDMAQRRARFDRERQRAKERAEALRLSRERQV